MNLFFRRDENHEMKLFRSENEKKAVLKAAEKRVRAKMDDAAHRFQPGKRVMFEVN